MAPKRELRTGLLLAAAVAAVVVLAFIGEAVVTPGPTRESPARPPTDAPSWARPETAPPDSEIAVAEPEAGLLVRTLERLPHPSLSGVVRDTSCQPVAGALVRVYVSTLGSRHATATDPEGRFDLGALPGGWYFVELLLPGRGRALSTDMEEVDLTEFGRRVEVTVPDTAIACRVVLPEPIDGFGETMTVAVYGQGRCVAGGEWPVLVEEDLRFHASGLPEGRYSVSVEYFGHRTAALEVRTRSGMTSEVRVPLERRAPGQVCMRVLDPSGGLVRGAGVSLQASRTRIRLVETQPGEYERRDVPPGLWSLSAYSHRRGFSGTASSTIEVPEGKAVYLDVVLTPR